MPNLYQVAIAAARRYGLDPAIFIAMIQVESGFQPSATSPAGAGGIAQFMPATWRGVIAQHPELERNFGANPDPQGRYDPVPALYASAAHLSDLLRASGSYQEALGAYYAGFGGRRSVAAQRYASLVLGRAPRSLSAPAGTIQTQTPWVASRPDPLITPRVIQSIISHLERAGGVSERIIEGFRRIGEGVSKIRPPEPLSELPIPERVATPKRFGPAPTPLELQLRRAQFGALVSGLRGLGGLGKEVVSGWGEVGKEALERAAPIALPVIETALKPFEMEERFIGRPLAKALFTVTPLRLLELLPGRAGEVAEDALDVAERITGSVLVPSTFLLPFAGRSVRLTGVLGRLGLRALTKGDDLARVAQEARLAIRTSFASTGRLAAELEAHQALAAQDPQVLRSIRTIERARGRLRTVEERIAKLGGADTIQVKTPRGSRLLTREELLAQQEKLRGRIELAKERIIEVASFDPRISPHKLDPRAVNEVMELRKGLGRFNRNRFAFWRKHITDDQFEDLRKGLERALGLDLARRPPPGISEREWRRALVYVRELGGGPFIDASRLGGTMINWLARRDTWLARVPIMGAATRELGLFLQPIARWPNADAGLFLAASNYSQAFAKEAFAETSAVLLALRRAFPNIPFAGRPFRNRFLGDVDELAGRMAQDYLERQRALGLGFTDEGAQAIRNEARQVADEIVGTWNHVVENPERYQLSAQQRSALAFLQDVQNYNRATGEALGVSVGEWQATPYLMHKARESAAQGPLITQAMAPRYARMFRRRSLPTIEEFAFELKRAGNEIETDIRVLLDRRFGQMARKKGEQITLTLMSETPELSYLVERPIRVIAGKTTYRDLVEEYGEQIARNLDPHDPEGALDAGRQIAERFIRDELGVEDLGRRVRPPHARFFTSSELRLRTIDRAKALRPQHLSEEEAEAAWRRWNNYLTGRGTAEVSGPERMLNLSRTVFLTADASPIAFVHGARIFAQDPLAYLQGIARFATMSMTDQGKTIWALQNLPGLRYAARHGLQLGTPMDIPLRSLLGARAKGRTFLEKLGIDWNPLARLNEQLFDAVNIAKYQLWNTSFHTLLLAQDEPGVWRVLRALPFFRNMRAAVETPSLTTEEIAQIAARGVNNWIGPINWAEVNAEGRPRALESFVFLTPSWLRGNVGTILNAANKSGLEGVMARHLLINQLAIQAALGAKLNLALTGQLRPEFFDPRSNDFLRIQTPGLRFDIVPGLSYIRTTLRTMTSWTDEERRKREAPWEAVARDLEFFVQSRLGLAPRLFTDLATGHDLLGRKQGAGESYLRAIAPLALQQIYDLVTDDLSAEDKALGAALALGGAPVVPKSPIRRYRETLETLTGEDADQITPVERAELERRHPELQELRKQITAYRKERVAPLDQFLTQMDTLRDKQERLVEVFLKNKRGQPDLEREWSRLASQLVAQRAQHREALIQSLFESEEEFEAQIRKSPERSSALELIAQEFWELNPSDFIDPETGARVSIDLATSDRERQQIWRAFRRAREELLEERGKELGVSREEIERYLTAWGQTRFRHPEAQLLERRRIAAQRARDAFFDIPAYRWFGGRAFTPQEQDRLFQLREEIEADLEPLRLLYNAGGQDLPTGSRRLAIIRRFLRPDASELDRNLLAWQLLFDQIDGRTDALRNPAHRQWLVDHPDMILFFPTSVSAWLGNWIFATPLGEHPKVLETMRAQR
ncbi:MAG: transglycosylase SLT domain-containing protein [Candidatus Nitrosotenuis sp.]